MPIQPVPIDEASPVPSSGDPEETFDPMFEASLTWQREKLRPQANALAEATYQNTVEAVAAKEAAQDSAEAAAASVTAAGQLVVAAGEQADAAEMSAQSAQVAAAAAGAAAGLPALAGEALQFLRVKSDETGVEFAAVDMPTLLVQKFGIFADGASALAPVSSGEVIFDTTPNTGLAAIVNSVGYSNNLWIATGPLNSVATAASPTGPWTVRSFAAVLTGSRPNIGTDGTNSMVCAGGGVAVARSTNGTTWTSAAALPAAATPGGTPVCIGGIWLIASGDGMSAFRSTNHGTSWTTEALGGTPIENTVCRIGSYFCYFQGGAIKASATGVGATGFVSYAHGLGFTPNRITPLPDNTCAFTDPYSGQVYIASEPNVVTLQPGVFCPVGCKMWRINGVWVFTPTGSSIIAATVQTATGGSLVARFAASSPVYSTVNDVAMPFATAGGMTLIPRAASNIDATNNGRLIVVNHSASRQALFGV